MPVAQPTDQDYQALVRGTPFAVYAGQARRNMRTLSESSQPPVASPVSQSGSLPEMDQQQYAQRVPLSQSWQPGSSVPNVAMSAAPAALNYGHNFNLDTTGYPLHVGQYSDVSAIPAWRTETARLGPYNALPTPMADHPYSLMTPELMGSMLPSPPTAPMGTVQPSDIFRQMPVKDASYPQTALGTPDTSARATPNADELSFTTHKATPAGPSALWQPLAPKTDPVPSTKTLKLLQTPPESSEDVESNHSIDDSPMSGPIVLQAVKGNGEKKKRTRTPQACEACRKRKAKCTGGQPCGRCTTKRISCIFADIRPKPVTVKPLVTPHGPHRLPVPPGAKRRRHSEVVRMTKEAAVSSTPAMPVPIVGVDQTYTPDPNNLLQLQLEVPSYPAIPWPQYNSQPAYGYTGQFDSSGLAALGFHHSYTATDPWAAMPTPTQFIGFNNLTLSDGSDASLMTPSVSIDSSPCYADASLLSPYDHGVFGPMATDSYFPQTEA